MESDSRTEILTAEPVTPKGERFRGRKETRSSEVSTIDPAGGGGRRGRTCGPCGPRWARAEHIRRAYWLALRVAKAMAAAVPAPAASSQSAAGALPQSMFTSVLLVTEVVSVYGPSVQTTLFCFVL